MDVAFGRQPLGRRRKLDIVGAARHDTVTVQVHQGHGDWVGYNLNASVTGGFNLTQ